jgi:hypothetical protein
MHVTSWELVTPPCSSCTGLGATTGGGATRNSVIDAFPKVQGQWEGVESEMYTDVLGLVTTAIGYLVDDKSGINGYGPALVIPWIHKSDGQPATKAEIIQDWQTVKNAHKASGSYDAPNDRKITQLKISPLVIQDLTASRMADNEKYLLQSLPHLADAPADAQMAIHGMAWAMGGAFIPKDGFHAFADAVNRGDWVAAKANSNFRGAAPQRKAGQDKMFDNAAIVAANKLDPDKLWYPGDAPTTAAGHLVASFRRPVVVVAVVAGLVAIGGVTYWAATRPVPRLLPARA